MIKHVHVNNIVAYALTDVAYIWPTDNQLYFIMNLLSLECNTIYVNSI